jgi:hypothetical protein
MKPLAIFAALLAVTNAVLWMPHDWRLSLAWIGVAMLAHKVEQWGRA